MVEASEKAEQLRKDYQSVFNSEAGGRVLEDLKKTCYFYTTTITTDSNVTAFNEGQRAVVLHIETKLKLTAERIKELENDRGQS